MHDMTTLVDEGSIHFRNVEELLWFSKKQLAHRLQQLVVWHLTQLLFTNFSL